MRVQGCVAPWFVASEIDLLLCFGALSLQRSGCDASLIAGRSAEETDRVFAPLALQWSVDWGLWVGGCSVGGLVGGLGAWVGGFRRRAARPNRHRPPLLVSSCARFCLAGGAPFGEGVRAEPWPAWQRTILAQRDRALSAAAGRRLRPVAAALRSAVTSAQSHRCRGPEMSPSAGA